MGEIRDAQHCLAVVTPQVGQDFPILDGKELEAAAAEDLHLLAQERSAYSMLSWMKRLIGLRKQVKVFGRGTLEFLPVQNRKVLAYLRSYDGETVLCVSNLAHPRELGQANTPRASCP